MDFLSCFIVIDGLLVACHVSLETSPSGPAHALSEDRLVRSYTIVHRSELLFLRLRLPSSVVILLLIRVLLSGILGPSRLGIQLFMQLFEHLIVLRFLIVNKLFETVRHFVLLLLIATLSPMLLVGRSRDRSSLC